MYDNILIATDGSEQSEPAVETGLGFAESFGATVHAMYVIETKATYILTAKLDDDEMDEYREYGRGVVEDVVEQAAGRGLEGKSVVKSGRISQEIIRYADNNDIDHIVVGKQGRGAIEKYVGSTAEKVMRMSGVPVTVVGPAPA